MKEYFVNVSASLLANLIWIVGIAIYAWVKKRNYDKILNFGFPNLQINQPGWIEYLNKYKNLYEKLKESQGANGSNTNWQISDAIGALDLVRKTKQDIQKSFFTRLFYSPEIAELERIENILIEFLDKQRTNIQNKTI